MSRADHFYGAGNPDVMFGDHATTSVPWPKAITRKDRFGYDETKVGHALRNPEAHIAHLDPRTLTANQSGPQRAAVSHYQTGTTDTFAQHHVEGNRTPV